MVERIRYPDIPVWFLERRFDKKGLDTAILTRAGFQIVEDLDGIVGEREESRQWFGLTYIRGDEFVMRACISRFEKDNFEPELAQCTIPAGDYIKMSIENYADNMAEADRIYKSMARANAVDVDRARPNLHHYKGNTLDLLLPVK